MYLEHVSVRNFRNLRDVEVWLRPGFNVLVGRNNTGKSNLFQAIRHALGPIATRGDWLPPLNRDDLLHDGAAYSTTPIRIDLAFAGLSEGQRAQFIEILDYDVGAPEESRARIHFEVAWDEERRRFQRPKRWGGPESSDSEVPYELLQALPVTFLPALRDAEEALSPGRGSRLAPLLEELARHEPSEGYEDSIRDIFAKANAELVGHDLIQAAIEKVTNATREMSGSDFVGSTIRASDADFGRVLRSLRILADQNPIPDLSASGLGYNNLLYIATVLSHLSQVAKDEVPLLLIEEPEAHLHPQLAQRLGAFLAGELPGSEEPPQTLVATHSPTLAAHAKPSQVAVLFTKPGSPWPSCNSIGRIGLTAKDERFLARLLDITKASLFFAKGLILVEGVTEELLLPVLANRLGIDLSERHVSVIPLAGVSFKTLGRVLGPDGLGVPVAIVTDADPRIEQQEDWKTARPVREGGSFPRSSRATSLVDHFEGHSNIRVFVSEVTLEYDLAAEDDKNAVAMATVWNEAYGGSTVNLEDVIASDEKALLVWRGACLARHGWSKADFAHVLAEHLVGGEELSPFSIPAYLEDAIRFASRSPKANGEPLGDG